MEHTTENIEQIAAIARSLGCLTEAEFQALAGITPNTAKSWRNRGKAPQPVLFGTRYFYPLSEIQKVINDRMATTPDVQQESTLI